MGWTRPTDPLPACLIQCMQHLPKLVWDPTPAVSAAGGAAWDLAPQWTLQDWSSAACGSMGQHWCPDCGVLRAGASSQTVCLTPLIWTVTWIKGEQSLRCCSEDYFILFTQWNGPNRREIAPEQPNTLLIQAFPWDIKNWSNTGRHWSPTSR